jgi:hypothetical protein
MLATSKPDAGLLVIFTSLIFLKTLPYLTISIMGILMVPNYVNTNLLRLQAQSDIARAFFLRRVTFEVLYQTLGESVEFTPHSSSSNL